MLISESQIDLFFPSLGVAILQQKTIEFIE